MAHTTCGSEKTDGGKHPFLGAKKLTHKTLMNRLTETNTADRTLTLV